ncbi:MAG: LamB/YcsF family protein [Fimbriimonadaceae bacterium]|nr:LamB/YcsF family protein [Fimbriimonadaceae bacterium]QYK55677.1 MAG: LamB/YcsF family protein [Fimbriimonadaceae bacterium]
MKRIDLNVDLGEGSPDDQSLMALASSANVCAGEHAGSRVLALETMALAREACLRVGIHPGYPDRANFGRVGIGATGLDPTLVRASLLDQCRFGMAEGAAYLKPHGAFYNESASEGWAFECLCACLRETGLPLLGLAATAHESAAESVGVGFFREGFADRGYGEGGRLLPRGGPGAMLAPAEAAAQAVRLAAGVDSLCVHGDGPQASETLHRVRAALVGAGYEVGA